MGDVVDELLRYGLFFGAIFQIICIAAVVFIPPKDDGRDGGDSSDEDAISTEGPAMHSVPSYKHHGHHSSRRNRQEKKKRR